MIIGNKEIFAIEIGDYNKTKESARLRMIIGGKTFGDFKKSQKVKPFLDVIASILAAGDDLYDSSFITASQQEIFSMVLVLDAEVGEWADSDYEQLDRYERFTFFWGEQFSNVSAIVYNREGNCNFIWSMKIIYPARK